MRYTFNGTLHLIHPPPNETRPPRWCGRSPHRPHHPTPPPRVHVLSRVDTLNTCSNTCICTPRDPKRTVSPSASLPGRLSGVASPPRARDDDSSEATVRAIRIESNERSDGRTRWNERSNERGRRDARRDATRRDATDRFIHSFAPGRGGWGGWDAHSFIPRISVSIHRRDARTTDGFARERCRNDWCPKGCSRMCFKSTS